MPESNMKRIDLEAMREHLRAQIADLQRGLEGLQTQLDWLEAAIAKLESIE